MRGAKEAPAPRNSLNVRRASLLSRNEFENWTFTIVLHATSSFTYISVIYGANFPFKVRAIHPHHALSDRLHNTMVKRMASEISFDHCEGSDAESGDSVQIPSHRFFSMERASGGFGVVRNFRIFFKSVFPKNFLGLPPPPDFRTKSLMGIPM